MRYTEQQKTDFETRLSQVKSKLKEKGRMDNYGVLAKTLYPQLKFRQLYNVMHGCTKNFNVLEALEKVANFELSEAA